MYDLPNILVIIIPIGFGGPILVPCMVGRGEHLAVVGLVNDWNIRNMLCMNIYHVTIYVYYNDNNTNNSTGNNSTSSNSTSTKY